MGSEYKFINPYNFIPVGEDCNRTKRSGKTYTGYIECELETLTPLIMLDTTNYKEDKEIKVHKIYKDTYKLNGIPAIPASELRGMIRNKFETLTNSCMSSTEEELPFYGRYNGNMRKAGLLDFSKPNKPKLYDCSYYKLDDEQYNLVKDYIQEEKKDGNALPKTGDCIKLDIKEFYQKGKKRKSISIKKSGKHESYLKIGELFNNKHAYHLFVKGDDVSAENSSDFVKMYKEIADTYKDNLERDNVVRNHDSYTSSNLKPVWYEKSANYVYFSLGQNGQTKYRRRLKDVMFDEFLPCKDKNNLCEGCQLFGTIQDDLSVAGKVRFEDAYLLNQYVNNYIDRKGLVLEELAGPKYSNALFYMYFFDKNEKKVFDFTEWNWNVDFYSKFNPKKIQLNQIKDGYIEIRGRKEYWHHKPANRLNVEVTKRNITVDTVKSNVKYAFKVYFDNITEEQLEHLNMAISLENNSTYAHKLGHGKPLGYGSVKIKTTNIVCRDVKLKDGKFVYSIEKWIPSKTKLFDVFNKLTDDQMYAIEQMYDFKFLLNKNIVVDYPRNEKDGLIYEWFESNKNNKMDIDNKSIKQQSVLPFAEGEYDDLIQKGYEKKKKNTNKGNSNAFKGKRKSY